MCLSGAQSGNLQRASLSALLSRLYLFRRAPQCSVLFLSPGLPSKPRAATPVTLRDVSGFWGAAPTRRERTSPHVLTNSEAHPVTHLIQSHTHVADVEAPPAPPAAAVHVGLPLCTLCAPPPARALRLTSSPAPLTLACPQSSRFRSVVIHTTCA